MSPVVPHFDENALIEHVRGQRWFGAKSRELVGATVLDVAALREIDPQLFVVLAELRYPDGTSDLYQLLAGADAEIHDALADDSPEREIVHMIRRGSTIAASEGVVEFHAVPGFAGLGRELHVARRIESEQSNTSVVFDEELILKVFRRLEPGLNPELELLRFLTEQALPHVLSLGGWYAYVGRPLEATLGLLPRLRRLGEVTGALHTALGGGHGDPAFCAEEPSAESLARLTATIDGEIVSVFAELPPWTPWSRSPGGARRYASGCADLPGSERPAGSSDTTATTTSARCCGHPGTG